MRIIIEIGEPAVPAQPVTLLSTAGAPDAAASGADASVLHAGSAAPQAEGPAAAVPQAPRPPAPPAPGLPAAESAGPAPRF